MGFSDMFTTIIKYFPYICIAILLMYALSVIL